MNDDHDWVVLRGRAKGNWSRILAWAGVSPAALTGKHGPCPMCGGTDRYRFDDKAGAGTFFCTRCGAGDGFTFLNKFTGKNYAEIKKWLAEQLGGQCMDEPSHRQSVSGTTLHAASRVWNESYPVKVGDPVYTYLTESRRLSVDSIPPCLRYHPSLVYRDDATGQFSRFPAMVSCVSSADGSFCTVHRTYLSPGTGKAHVDAPKKLMPGKLLHGAAVRLYEAQEELGIAEVWKNAGH